MDRLDAKWTKAAIVGGLWASVEIIVGSFLHNLNIPMSGTILGANGVILLIAFDRSWGEKGMIWRAGLITALMKSISPSAVILGPMIGIFTEALMLELGVRLFGRNPVGYLIGGILAVSAILVHKVVSLLIKYGFDVVDIYLNIFKFAVRQIRIPDADPVMALGILLGIYIAIGISAALTGMGLSTGGWKGRTLPSVKAPIPAKVTGFREAEQRFSHALLILHGLMIPAILLLINMMDFWYIYPITAVYIVFVFVRYPKGFRRVRKPVFWVQLLILTLLAGLFFEGLPSVDQWFKVRGLAVGLEMSLRAVFVVAAFSGFSAELADPRIRNYLSDRGFRKVYLSMELAFAALPAIIDAMPSARTLLLKPGKAFRVLLVQADEMIDSLITESSQN